MAQHDDLSWSELDDDLEQPCGDDVDPAGSGGDDPASAPSDDAPPDAPPEGYDPADDPSTQVPDGRPGSPLRGLPALPKRKAAIPAWVLAHGNGKVPEDAMVRVAPVAGGFLVPEAAARWRSLQLAAQEHGFSLTMTGAYRSYDQQVQLFTQRYGTEPTDHGSKVWDGTTYWLKPGMAMAAVPGNSNHGWGAAVDCALGGYGRNALPVTSDGRFVTWFIANAPDHGWSWETQSEPWHIRVVSLADTTSTLVGGAGRDAASTDPAANVPPHLSVPAPTLQRNSRGGQVAVLQSWCQRRAWGDVGRADGVFGPRTESAVKVIQLELGVTDDGVYGPKTAAALKDAAVGWGS
jgi:hypothetical protein